MSGLRFWHVLPTQECEWFRFYIADWQCRVQDSSANPQKSSSSFPPDDPPAPPSFFSPPGPKLSFRGVNRLQKNSQKHQNTSGVQFGKRNLIWHKMSSTSWRDGQGHGFLHSCTQMIAPTHVPENGTFKDHSASTSRDIAGQFAGSEVSSY